MMNVVVLYYILQLEVIPCSLSLRVVENWDTLNGCNQPVIYFYTRQAKLLSMKITSQGKHGSTEI